jgi:hypothetical protein
MTDDQIRSIIQQAVEAAMQTYSARPPCGLSPTASTELTHLMGCFKDIGGGGPEGYGRGIEAFRECFRAAQNLQEFLKDENLQKDIRFVRSWRQARDKTGNLVLGAIVVFLVGLALKITGSGAWQWLKTGIGKAVE